MVDTAPIESIAVVGLALRLPGGANDVESLWKLLESGEPTWTPVPADRYNEEAFYHPDADDPNGTSNHRGGHFISSDVRDFDHAFFQFSKSQAAAVDPQQRLLMELTYEALESGGIPRESIAGTATSVYTAIFPTDYNGLLYRDPLDLPTYYMTGVEKALFSNRISHALDLRGPSMTLDTACSGGLVALHQGCRAIQSGECDTSIVAASNLILGPDHFIGLSNLHLLSSTGRCYPFDERGKGYGRGEGVVVLVLRRLKDAIRNRDPVRAVIRSTAVGQDGYTPQSITYPNGRAQADLARTAYARVGLQPQDVAYVEAHGTGTKAGDKEELEGIAEVFAGSTDRSLPLYVGSIKGAIGHGEAVAGLASFLKAALMLDYELIPPVAGFSTPKPGLPLSHMQIPTKVLPWPHANGVTPRISVSNFGFGGTNVHTIVEQAPRRAQQTLPIDAALSPRLFVLSANSSKSLKDMIQAQRNWLEKHQDSSLADLSYTLLHRRTALPYRFSAVAETHTSLLEALSQGVSASEASPTDQDLFMVFTGQGAQWAGMGRELLSERTTPSSFFRNSIRASSHILQKLGASWDLETELLRDASESRLMDAEISQPTITSIQIAILALLHAQGLQPRAVVGHSSGEIAAAYAAGYLSQESAITVAFYRGRMAAAAKTKGLGHGAMLSVGLGEDEASKYVKDLRKGKAVVACINSPRSVTISGDADAVDEVCERLAEANDGTFYRKLLVDTAYHSHHMAAVAEDYRVCLGALKTEEGTERTNGQEVAFISSVTGQPKISGFGADYWVTNFVSPVRFSHAVQTLCKERDQQRQQALFIEVGPHSALSGPVRQCLQATDMPQFRFDYHATLQRQVNAITSTLSLAGKLFERGIRIPWDVVSALSSGADAAVVRHDLPSYPWDHSTKHWHESRIARAYRTRAEPYHDLLGVPALDASKSDLRWRHFLSQSTLPWLADHTIDGLTVFPGSGFICMAIEGVAQHVRQTFKSRQLETVVLRDVLFKSGLVVPERERVELQLSLKPHGDSDLAFAFSITALTETGQGHEHATGIVEGVLADEGVAIELMTYETSQLSLDGDTIYKDAIYREMNDIGNAYGPAFAGLDHMTMASDASKAVSSLQVRDIQASMPGKHQRPHIIHPSTLEIVFNTALPLASRHLEPGSIMPVHVGEILVAGTAPMQRPGSKLEVSTFLTSHQPRTATSDILVTASGCKVLSASNIEFRCFGSPNTSGITGTSRDTCYELDWLVPINHVRTQDMPSNLTIGELVAKTTLRSHEVSTIGLAASVELSNDFLQAVQTNSRVVLHDFVDTTHGHFEDAADCLQGFPVQYRALQAGANPIARGYDADAYDIVLVAAPERLHQAARLVKPGGTILVVLTERNIPENAWRKHLKIGGTPLKEQLSICDDVYGRIIVLTKPISMKNGSKIRILRHSSSDAPSWVTAIEQKLRTRDVDVVVEELNSSTVQGLLRQDAMERSSDETVIVTDDRVELPILSDADTFDAANGLFAQPICLVWVSPNDLAPSHQIEGVARTAHAENEDLRLTTIHADSSILTDVSSHEHLVDVISSAIGLSTNPETPHLEREYRIRETGTVVVPRLRHSDRLNRVIAGDSAAGLERQDHLFADPQRPVMLSKTLPTMFVDDDKILATPLSDDEIDVAIDTFRLPARDSADSINECTGLVERIGKNVKSLNVGDRVVALAPTSGSSRIRVPCTHAACLPSNVASHSATALLLSIMTASYALRGVARLLSSGGAVLIHGVRTAAGRAAFAVARSIGVRVIVTGVDSKDAKLLAEQLNIDATDVLVARPSFHRRLPRELFAEGLDAVVHAAKDPVPPEALSYIKPFGSILLVEQALPSTMISKLPPNVGLHSIDIASLLQDRPDLIASLVSDASKTLENVPLSGLEIPSRDVSQISDAIQLIQSGVHANVVLQVEPSSTVQLMTSTRTDPWTNEDATYVVAGGLGDIGQRVLIQMAHRGAKHLATISRRKVDPETHRKLAAKLDAVQPGIRLYTIQGDILCSSSMSSAATTLAHQGAPPVHGIIQAAAIFNDQPLERSASDDFENVANVKVNGTLSLYSAFASSELAFFLCLSSAAGIVGTSAQASYNAGNAVQDALAQEKQPRFAPTRFISVNLGWIEDAAIITNDEASKNALHRAGLRPIGAKELTRFLDYILRTANSPETQLSQAVIGFDAESLAGATTHNGTIMSAMFNNVRSSRNGATAASQADGAEDSGPTFEDVIRGGDAEAVEDFISSGVKAHLARLISVDADRIDQHQGSILELGLDSLVAVELRNWVMRQFDAPLQSTEILTHQTVQTLAGKVAARSKRVLSAAA